MLRNMLLLSPAVMATAIIFAPTPFVLAAPQSRGLTEASTAPAPADDSTVESPALAPGFGPVPATPTTSDSTLESGGRICEGQGNNAASFNFAIGEFSAKVLLDHIFPIDIVGQLILADATIRERALQAYPGNPGGAFINILFVDTGKDRILVDTGNGLNNNGSLYEELQANDIEPESITKILLTHGHSDHFGGLFRDAAATILAFPNAKVYVSKVEWEFWTAPNVNISATALPPDLQPLVIELAKTVLNAIKDRVVLFELDTEILPGIQSISTPWHTPGHSAYLFKSGNDTLLATGDALASDIFAVENPWFLIASDLPPAAAPAGRYKLLDRAVKEKWLLNLMHGTFPGLGYVTEDKGTRFHFHKLRWTPAPRAVAVCPA